MGRHIIQRHVRSDSFVNFELIISEAFNFFDGMKQIGVQDIFEVSAIEAFDICVLSWLLGWIKANLICRNSAQSANVLEINSGPLSKRSCFGYPRYKAIISNTQIILADGMEVATSIHKPSRLKSSMMFKVRMLRPLARLSCMKSSDQE